MASYKYPESSSEILITGNIFNIIILLFPFIPSWSSEFVLRGISGENHELSR